MSEVYHNELRQRAREKLYGEWGQIGDFDIGIEATLESLGEMIEIPRGWEEFHREMGGQATKDGLGRVNIRLPNPTTVTGEVYMGFKPEFLCPGTRVGMILVRPE